jgi:hypothetical protein
MSGKAARAALYARVSTGEQNPDMQLAELRDICRAARLDRPRRVCRPGRQRRESVPARTGPDHGGSLAAAL